MNVKSDVVTENTVGQDWGEKKKRTSQKITELFLHDRFKKKH